MVIKPHDQQSIKTLWCGFTIRLSAAWQFKAMASWIICCIWLCDQNPHENLLGVYKQILKSSCGSFVYLFYSPLLGCSYFCPVSLVFLFTHESNRTKVSQHNTVLAVSFIVKAQTVEAAECCPRSDTISSSSFVVSADSPVSPRPTGKT